MVLSINIIQQELNLDGWHFNDSISNFANCSSKEYIIMSLEMLESHSGLIEQILGKFY